MLCTGLSATVLWSALGPLEWCSMSKGDRMYGQYHPTWRGGGLVNAHAMFVAYSCDTRVLDPIDSIPDLVTSQHDRSNSSGFVDNQIAYGSGKEALSLNGGVVVGSIACVFALFAGLVGSDWGRERDGLMDATMALMALLDVATDGVAINAFFNPPLGENGSAQPPHWWWGSFSVAIFLVTNRLFFLRARYDVSSFHELLKAVLPSSSIWYRRGINVSCFFKKLSDHESEQDLVYEFRFPLALDHFSGTDLASQHDLHDQDKLYLFSWEQEFDRKIALVGTTKQQKEQFAKAVLDKSPEDLRKLLKLHTAKGKSLEFYGNPVLQWSFAIIYLEFLGPLIGVPIFIREQWRRIKYGCQVAERAFMLKLRNKDAEGARTVDLDAELRAVVVSLTEGLFESLPQLALQTHAYSKGALAWFPFYTSLVPSAASITYAVFSYYKQSAEIKDKEYVKQQILLEINPDYQSQADSALFKIASLRLVAMIRFKSKMKRAKDPNDQLGSPANQQDLEVGSRAALS
jgi:hypothetical protein